MENFANFFFQSFHVMWLQTNANRTCQMRRTSYNSTVYFHFFTAVCFEWNSKLFTMIINCNYPCYNLLICIESRHHLYLSHFRLAFRNITQSVWWDHTLVWLQMGRCYLSGSENIDSLESNEQQLCLYLFIFLPLSTCRFDHSMISSIVANLNSQRTPGTW